MPPLDDNQSINSQKLPQDNQRPFTAADPARDDSLPADNAGQLQQVADDTHPDTDTEVDPTELYQDGTAAAAGMSEPNAGNAVTGYTPPTNDADDFNEISDSTDAIEDSL